MATTNSSTKIRSLALPALAPTVKPQRFTQTIKDPEVQDMLNSYLQVYQQTYKLPIDRNTMVELMLKKFLLSDKDFLKVYKALPQTPDAVAQRAAESSKHSGDAEEASH